MYYDWLSDRHYSDVQQKLLPRSEIPDQLYEKLSLGLLGWEAIVRLDGELDKDVPDDKCIIALDLIWRT